MCLIYLFGCIFLGYMARYTVITVHSPQENQCVRVKYFSFLFVQNLNLADFLCYNVVIFGEHKKSIHPSDEACVHFVNLGEG